PLSVDSSAPTDPSIVIAGGNSWTRSASVTLSLSAVDDVGVDSMCISKTSTCSSWAAYTTSKTYSLGSTQDTNTLNVWFRDASGNVSAMASDSIGLDSVKPTDGAATATPSSGQVELSWTGFQDAGSGIVAYTVVYSTTTAPSSCAMGTVAYSGPASSFTHTGLTDGTTYRYRICTTDEAGNSSSGISISARPAPEYNEPTGGTVEINGGATWTKSKTVTLAIAAADDTEVSAMCISNTATCNSWVAYATTKSFVITGVGARTLSVWFRDVYGNVTSTPATDTIIVDTSKPTGGAVTATGSAATMDLAWSNFVDGGSGVASYLVMRAVGTKAPACATTSAIYAGSNLSYSDTGLTDGTTYAWRVCAVDNAGNISTGVSTTGRPAPEYTVPVGTVLIDGGNTYAGKTSVSLSLDATDASGLSQMCISNTTTCKAWITYSATKSWTLNGKTGTRTVYASFKDIYGNVSTAVSDSILMDSTAPTGGTVAGTAGSGASIDLAYSGFTDAESGVASYKVVYVAGTTAPASCSTGTTGYSGVSVNPAISGLAANTTYAFRVCALDAVGNVGTGVTTTAATAAEADPPADTSLLINDGDATSTLEQVLLNLSASDATGVALMCISDDPESCTSWESYATEGSWTFDAVEGEVSLYAWFEDDLGNRTTEPADATILLDWSAPED
ncbi:MAG TPA: fibronectin type III domain-containing protein, partial [Myxococcota bacterium]|nr:fibronectin type III domain-containing protein [Myxococcota bacterium]